MDKQFAKMKHVLCVAAHYDDEALFFGGTLLELARRGIDIHIAVLTDVRYCNPPRTDEQWAREHIRRRTRLGAFARVCVDLHARAYHANLKQTEQILLGMESEAAQRFIGGFIKAIPPDLILTHGTKGDYVGARYGVSNYDTARAQHKMARACVVAANPDCPVWAYDLNGKTKVKVDFAAKARLLDYYRYGCTQAPEWPAERWYPEFALAEEERFTCP